MACRKVYQIKMLGETGSQQYFTKGYSIIGPDKNVMNLLQNSR